ncbi:MAG: glycosyltransferase [Bacteroidales bacterium]|jgi:glycosyltransferase involved in cell wall biosynthesis|nr:glycosyltransferase [Bacteroidales bacterium]MCI1786309.1 glycosyltransferase [Bacteroidales bacterium]
MNKTGNYEFTIIVPVFNEEDNIDSLVEVLSGFLPHCIRKACVLFVDDGSSDSSLSKIKAACEASQDLYYISFKKNSGLSTALKAGIDFTESEYAGYMDADMQTAPDDFNLLLEDIDGYSMVTGFRADRKDSFFKKIQSKIANGFRRMMTHDGAIDTGCPLKVFHSDVAKRIPLFKGLHRFLPAMVLLQEGGTYKQVPVRHFPRKAGTSKYHIWNRLWGPFSDCFAYRWMKSRYINYSIKDSDTD